ncbi:acyl-CoA thioesterase [Psychrosphaera sp. F3M07]|uniref:acyl-CoA thioesterase n=1 Tax=Psychrosphaera sp. F3M07 TaxID=2841560 RepID=UPI001C0A3576|nr:thioesterase family protein [Psychrosphaera sp. F3M07]MBU2917205.1 acyl-CoA thioesterase [Psychrosphaera sp. F3M07]
MSHTSQIKVRGFHLDIYQHVNNARYLEFLEEARWEYLEESGDIEFFQSLGLAWVIVNININYRASATMGHTLNIETSLSKVGGKSAVFNQKITIAGTDVAVADADITFVVLDQKTGKAVPIEGALLERMQSHLNATGEEI